MRRRTGRGEPGDLVCVLTGHADEELQLEFDRRSATSSNRGSLGLPLTEALHGEGRAAKTDRAGSASSGRRQRGRRREATGSEEEAHQLEGGGRDGEGGVPTPN